MEAWNKKDKFVPYLLVLIFAVMSAGIITAGYLYYSYYKTHLRAEVEKQLSSVGKLKADELVNWQTERLGAVISFCGILLGGTGACFGLVWRRQRLCFYRKQYDTAKEWNTTFDSITDMVSIVGSDFRLKQVNKAFAKALCVKPEDLIGRHCYGVVHGTNEPIPDCPCKKTLLTNEPAKIEIFHEDLNKYLEISTSPIFNAQREVTDIIHIARDITERKRAEEELLHSKTMLENITRGISEGIMLLDKDYKILWANHSVLSQSGNKHEDISGKYCYQVAHNRKTPCCPPHDPCPIYDLQKTGCPANKEHVHFDKDGNEIFVEVSAYPVKDEKGEIVQFIHLSRDITERKRAENETL